MVNFRRMRLGDLDCIYKDPEIRPIITTTPKKSKFAVIMEENDHIQGGVTGYVTDNAAFVQSAVLKKNKDKSLYKDGLIRSLIHFLELDGVELLLIGEDDSVYPEIGFQKLQGKESFVPKLERIIEEEFNRNTVYWISTRTFFEKNNC